jgi:hypothetical protein
MLIAFAAIADEPRPDEPRPTNEGFVEFPTAEFQHDQLAERQAADAILHQFLTQRISPKFEKEPLDQVVQQLAKLTKRSFQLNVPALRNEAIPADIPITFAARKSPLIADVLDRILTPLQLAWEINGDIVRVTTIQNRNQSLRVRAYHVGNLLRLQAEREARLLPARSLVESNLTRNQTPEINFDGEQLEQALQSATFGPWKDSHGEGGSRPVVFAQQMLIQQHSQMHRDLAALLRGLERALARPTGSPPLVVTETDANATESARLQRLLETKLDVDLTATPLNEAVRQVSDKLDEEIVLDVVALLEEGIAPDSPVTFRGQGSAKTLLQQIGNPLQLTTEIRRGGIFVTTRVMVQSHLKPVVYDVADFLQLKFPIQDLIRLIHDSTAGPWLVTGGEGGTITEFRGGLLVIQQSEGSHAELAGLFDDLRKTLRAEPQSPRSKHAEMETRYHRTKSKSEAAALERVLVTLVAPRTWEAAGGRGQIGIADDRIVIRQTNAVHEQIDRFLNEYRQARPIGDAAK